MNVPLDSPLGGPPTAASGREVSCRIAGMFIETCERRGIAIARLLEGTGVAEPTLRDVHERIPWEAFLRLLDNVESLLGRDALHDVAAQFVRTPRAGPLRVIARFLLSPWDVLKWMETPGSGIQLVATCIDAKVLRLARDRFSVQLTLHPGYRPSAAWLELNRGGLASIPILLGADAPEVVADAIPGGARYTIQLAKGTWWTSTAQRWLSRILPDREAPAQLREALELLHRSHAELQRAEHARAVAQSRLLEARTLESLGRLAGGVAHDFNNILTVILAQAERLEGPHLDPAEHAEMVDGIRSAAKRATGLTRQLLTFGGRRPMALRAIRPRDAIEGLRGLLQRLIGEHIDLQLDVDTASGWVRADLSALEQIVLNLVTNARDAMPGGGRLTISVADHREDAVDLDAHGEGTGWVRIEVADSGEGIEDEIKPRIFEPFFTTKELGKGTGLGLATVFGAVKQSGGRIEVFSEAGRGTSFRVLLPRIEPPQDAPRAGAPRAARRPSREALRILYVEDDPHVRSAGLACLASGGHAVLVARDGEEGLRIGTEEIENIDVLVSDVVMPRLGGPALAAKLRRLRPDLPVVLVSGHVSDVIDRMGEDALVGIRLDKPYDEDGLLDAIARAVARTPSDPGPS